jgi:DNA-binding MarR family transcriptional regulator
MSAPAALELSVAVIATFRKLRVVGGKLHGREGPLTGERGILLGLAQNGPQTVPDMARVRGTSRQHVQVIVDRFIAAGHAERQPNPAHRRSPLIALTKKGHAEARRFEARESVFMSAMARSISAADMRAAAATLRAFAQALEESLP